ncbi:DUF4232 domain-containing protein [Streptomyces sp. NPDC050145]|uniref:DUF4232 domain-containing protein n=1 Tax=Streptomyces sp. NPDC050145 TaxID=3365602 RepID=UPI00378EDCC9
MRTQSKHAKTLTLAAVALAAGLSLTACQSGNDGDNDAAASTDPTASSSSASSPAPSSPGTEASSPAPDSTAGGGTGNTTGGTGDDKGSGGGQINTGPCKTANLTISATHGMGEGDVLVSLKNTSDACNLKGFAGVDLKTADGDTISANRTENAAPSVVLQNGEATRFTLHTPRNDSGGSGVKVTRLVITPPNETHSKTLAFALSLPVTDGSHPEQGVMVEPVGTGKQ